MTKSGILAGLLLPVVVLASCTSYEETTYPTLERSHRSIQRGRIGEGLDGYAAAVTDLLRYAQDERPAWIRPFLLFTLQRPGLWTRLEAHILEGSPDSGALESFLAFQGAPDALLEAACAALRSSRFCEQPGRWSRMPPWALPEMLRLTSDVLFRRAQSPDPVMADMGDVTAPLAERLGRLSLTHAACQFSIRAWEMAVDQKTWERDYRLAFHSVARRLAELNRTIADDAKDAAARDRWLDRGRRWDETASRAQENAPLADLDMKADVDFVRASVQDHYEDGLKAFGAAVEEYSGRGTVELAEEKYRRCLEHLLTARELKEERTKEESIRLSFVARAALGIQRLLVPP